MRQNHISNRPDTRYSCELAARSPSSPRSTRFAVSRTAKLGAHHAVGSSPFQRCVLTHAPPQADRHNRRSPNPSRITPPAVGRLAADCHVGVECASAAAARARHEATERPDRGAPVRVPTPSSEPAKVPTGRSSRMGQALLSAFQTALVGRSPKTAAMYGLSQTFEPHTTIPPSNAAIAAVIAAGSNRIGPRSIAASIMPPPAIVTRETTSTHV